MHLQAYGGTPGEVLIWIKWAECRVRDDNMRNLVLLSMLRAVCFFLGQRLGGCSLTGNHVYLLQAYIPIAGMALQQTIQPTDKSSSSSRFCCHCHSRSLTEGKCKAATEGRKFGCRISTDCSTGRLLSKNREHNLCFWETQTVSSTDAAFCRISWCFLGMH